MGFISCTSVKQGLPLKLVNLDDWTLYFVLEKSNVAFMVQRVRFQRSGMRKNDLTRQWI